MADEKKTESRKADKVGHAWVVLDETGAVHMVERSQLRAALAAIEVEGSLLKWPNGATRHQVMGGNN